MNGGAAGGGGGGQRKFLRGPPTNGRKSERDEDLLLFRELHKKEKDRIASLLQPVSDEFEANGNYPLYKMASAKKGSGYEFLGEGGKNDYDWLKTPPATPLFPSLEMEGNVPELAVQREFPIFQPLSRFSGNPVATTKSSGRSKSPIPKQKAPPRSVTPSQMLTVSGLETKPATKNRPMSTSQKSNQSTMSSNIPISRRGANAVAKPMNTLQKESPQNFLASNLSKGIGPSEEFFNQPKNTFEI